MQDFEDHEKPHDYWMSYSDMMAALILMFILLLMLLIFSYSEILQAKIKEREKLTENLKKTEQKLESIVGIRKKIVEDLIKEFKNSKLSLKIDPQTGAITFSESVLFEYNSYNLTQNGKKFLQQFIPKYIGILLSPQNKDNISQIIIEGHTDNRGDYLYNLELSQKRAFEVVKYILSNQFPDFPQKQLLKKYITSNGRSFSQLIYKNGKVDQDASRRVEFKFRLKEEEMVRQMEQILKGASK
ncbi:OmpA family protein [Caldicellulosiruptor sp. DIB 104C]|uniref:OmpA family protein n=1 Tax=Caldicellulosiruptor sp. DIB 104C TaxID=3019889 RepID=UPI002305DB23|nr:OmpA family protein [Caldicellulosiruptor sp. DIB 104C]